MIKLVLRSKGRKILQVFELSGMWDLGLAPGTEERMNGKTG